MRGVSLGPRLERECHCGKKFTVPQSVAIRGRGKFCSKGCVVQTRSGGRPATHGMTRTPTYRSWESMKRRCLSPNVAGWEYYGGRGISVCDQWLASFEQFYFDMGERPLGSSIDRLDNDGNYEPGNCCWSTYSQQATNRRKKNCGR